MTYANVLPTVTFTVGVTYTNVLPTVKCTVGKALVEPARCEIH